MTKTSQTKLQDSEADDNTPVRKLKTAHIYKWFQYVPLFSCIPWTITLIVLITFWKSQGSPIYPWLKPSEEEGQDKAYRYANMNPVYISDVGATELQPLFIFGTLLTGFSYFSCLVYETVYRFRATFHVAKGLRIVQFFILFFGLIGQVGIGLVAILSTKDFPQLHQMFLSVFILGILFQLFLQIAQYGCLTYYHSRIIAKEITKREMYFNPFLRSSIMKVVFTIVAGILAIMFKLINFENYSINARFEWTLAFFYDFLFIIMWYDLKHLHVDLKHYNEIISFRNDTKSPTKEVRDISEIYLSPVDVLKDHQTELQEIDSIV